METTKTKAIITACSDKFFPSVINLLTSIKVNYPEHPPIYVYDLGLFYSYRKELEKIEGVTVIPMPRFCPHWRACYTWKTYVFTHPLADLNFYLDAGCQVLQPLDKDFEIIENDGVLLVDQGHTFRDIVPASYKTFLNISDIHDQKTVIHAGIIGFSTAPAYKEIFAKVHAAALAGLALGFSRSDRWRNKGKDKNNFERDCQLFRHDLTLVNIFFRLYQPTINIQPLEIYHGGLLNSKEQRVWHIRLNWKRTPYLSIKKLHKRPNHYAMINRIILVTIIEIRKMAHFIKGLNHK